MPAQSIPSIPDYSGMPAGQLFNQGNREQQVRDYINQTLQEYGGLNPYAGYQADLGSQGRQTQLSALGNLGGLLDNGWDPQSREAQRQAVNKANESTQGQTGSLLLNAQMGGTRTGAGSSADLATQAAQSQGQAQAANTAGRQGQAAALARRLQALGAYGSLAGSIRGGDINSAEQGFQNQLQQFGGMSAARNNLANYYTNQLNQGAAQNASNWQAALGAGGLALGGYGVMSGMQPAPYQSAGPTDFGLPGGDAPIPISNFPNYWNTP